MWSLRHIWYLKNTYYIWCINDLYINIHRVPKELFHKQTLLFFVCVSDMKFIKWKIMLSFDKIKQFWLIFLKVTINSTCVLFLSNGKFWYVYPHWISITGNGIVVAGPYYTTSRCIWDKLGRLWGQGFHQEYSLEPSNFQPCKVSPPAISEITIDIIINDELAIL